MSAVVASKLRPASRLLRTHYNVEIEHMLVGLLDRTDTDLAAILRQWEVDPARLSADLNRSLERMKTGNARAPVALARHRGDGQAGAGCSPPSSRAQAACAQAICCGPCWPTTLLARRARERPGTLAADSTRHCSSATTSRSAATPPKQRKRTSQAVGSEAAGTGSPATCGRAARRALDQFTMDLTAQARGRQDRSDPRPRLRDPPDDRHPDASPAEQPDPHRRGRASARPRSSRASRCASPPATCRRRCASVTPAHARSRPAAGRARA